MVHIEWTYAIIVTVIYASVYFVAFFITSIVAAKEVRELRKENKIASASNESNPGKQEVTSGTLTTYTVHTNNNRRYALNRS